MISEISQNLAGFVSTPSKGGSDSPSPVQETAGVEKVRSTPLPAGTRVPAPGDNRPGTVNRQELEEVVEDLNDFAQTVRRQLQFSVDEDSGKTIIKVLDAETGETIRDIPPEEIINMQKQLRETSEKLFHSNESGVSLLFQGKA